MMKFLRENVFAAGLILLLRLYIGWEWMTAGWHKLTGGFDAAGFLKNAVANPVADKADRGCGISALHGLPGTVRAAERQAD